MDDKQRKAMFSKKPPLEDFEQEVFVNHLRKNKIDFFAPINENSFSFLSPKLAVMIEAKAKKMGKLKGVLDLVIFLDDFILFMEFKRRPKLLKSGKLSYTNSKTSDDQKDFIEMLKKYKYTKSVICYGYDEAIEFIKEWL